ncbi:pyridoxamine 5'-phosphate oxidase [Paraburkholderia strydomiana]|nr:pyridoxamine 5'-phosphate oxidase [Paraburkholderia strydomiana]
MADTAPVAPGWPYRDSPFHTGEQAAQTRAGFIEAADSAGRRSIRDYMPDQHRQFYAQLPYMIVAGIDQSGQPWATMRIGRPGFVSSPDSRTLCIAGTTLPGDPLATAWHQGALFGGLGIEFPTRRRNRANGVVAATEDAMLTVAVSQSFGNCAKYIQARTPEWTGFPARDDSPIQQIASILSGEDHALLTRADTLFIASTHDSPDAVAARGIDVSHRGGMPGFVLVEDPRTFAIPDYAGNRFLNTVGNLMTSPQAGLLFPDFETGDVLYVAADAEILWDDPALSEFEGAHRVIRFHVRETRRSSAVLPFRWSAPQYAREFQAKLTTSQSRL